MDKDTKDHCVYHANGDPEAQQIRAFLKAHDIPCVFRGESTRITHAFTLNGLGVVQICVPLTHVEQARELLAKAESGELGLEAYDADEDGKTS